MHIVNCDYCAKVAIILEFRCPGYAIVERHEAPSGGRYWFRAGDRIRDPNQLCAPVPTDGSTGSCQQALRSDFSHIAGIPLSTLGVAFWVAQIIVLAAMQGLPAVHLRNCATRLHLFLTLAAIIVTFVVIGLVVGRLSTPCIFCLWHGIAVLVSLLQSSIQRQFLRVQNSGARVVSRYAYGSV